MLQRKFNKKNDPGDHESNLKNISKETFKQNVLVTFGTSLRFVKRMFTIMSVVIKFNYLCRDLANFQ